MKLRRRTVVAVSATAALLIGAAFALGIAFESSRGSGKQGSDTVATQVTAKDAESPVSAGLRSAKRRAARAQRGTGSQGEGNPTRSHQRVIPALPLERRLALSLLAARQRYLNTTTVTHYQKAHKNEITDGFCKPSRNGRYRCTINELSPPPSPRELKTICLGSTPTRRQRRECSHLPLPGGTPSPIVFDVSVHGDGCWSAVLPDNQDPEGHARLEGCLSAS